MGGVEDRSIEQNGSQPRPPRIGCIADDVSGATDLAGALARRGISAAMAFGPPSDTLPADVDVIVVALKTRSVESARARDIAGASLDTMRGAGVQQFYFKYCSTFDSTATGNIGPVADELLDRLNAEQIVHCPAYPENGRTVYLGHLFVGSKLLNESGMEHHPINPMTDSDLRRLLAPQTSGRVDLLARPVVAGGAEATTRRLSEMLEAGVRHVIADAIDDADLDTVARSVASRCIAAGGAPFGADFAAAALAQVPDSQAPPVLRTPVPTGGSAVLVGSASRASTEQVETLARTAPIRRVTAEQFLHEQDAVPSVLAWANERLSDGPVLIVAENRRDALQRARATLGSTVAAEAVEAGLARIAVGLVDQGVRRLIVAGGETSGAVADALRLRTVQIGPEVAPGVPWTFSSDPELAIVFKSGNFGGPSFFSEAFALLDAVADER